MSKEELFNEAIKYKSQNLHFTPDDLFFTFDSWKKIRELDKFDQVFAFRKIVDIFEIDYNIPLIDSALNNNSQALDFEEIEKWVESFEQSKKDKNKEE